MCRALYIHKFVDEENGLSLPVSFHKFVLEFEGMDVFMYTHVCLFGCVCLYVCVCMYVCMHVFMYL